MLELVRIFLGRRGVWIEGVYVCVCVCVCMCCYEAGQQLRVSKFCESEIATKDTHLVL
jgi:hypothetical protein